MTRYPTRRLPPSEENAAAGRTPIEKRYMVEFGRSLQHRRIKAGFKTQSALARAVWGEIEVKGTGRKAARNRDRISAYEKGKAFPDPANLAKLCEVLGCTPEELAPGLTAAAAEREDLSWSAIEASGHSDKVLLQVKKLVSFATMTRIAVMLDREDYKDDRADNLDLQQLSVEDIDREIAKLTALRFVCAPDEAPPVDH